MAVAVSVGDLRELLSSFHPAAALVNNQTATFFVGRNVVSLDHRCRVFAASARDARAVKLTFFAAMHNTASAVHCERCNTLYFAENP